MAHGYPSKSKIRSYFIKPFMMNKTTFHIGARGGGQRDLDCPPHQMVPLYQIKAGEGVMQSPTHYLLAEFFVVESWCCHLRGVEVQSKVAHPLHQMVPQINASKGSGQSPNHYP